MGWELEDVEKPLVAQLQSLGWTPIEGSLDAPDVTGRTSFAEVIQEGLLREQLRTLNPGPDGTPWLDETRLSEAVAAITRLGMPKLMEANEKATGLLLRGLTVEGLPGWDGGRGQTILLPARVAEYVAVHELVHLLEPHHTPAFWGRMERAMPDFAQRKSWLDSKGALVEGL